MNLMVHKFTGWRAGHVPRMAPLVIGVSIICGPVARSNATSSLEGGTTSRAGSALAISEGVVGNGRREADSTGERWVTDSRFVPSHIETLTSSCAIRGEFQVSRATSLLIFPRIS